MTLMIYFGQPIDQAHGVSPATADLVNALDSAGWAVYRPARAWTATQAQPDPRVEQVNRAALAKADCLVALLPAGVPTIGLPMEIEHATHLGIPTVVVSKVESYALVGNPLIYQIQHPASLVQLVRAAAAEHPRRPDRQLRMTLGEGQELPRRSYPDDAGIDLRCVDAHTVDPGTFVDIRTEVTGVQLPPDMWMLITGRSSTLRRKHLHVPLAVIDPGWRGPLFVGVHNLGPAPVQVEPGERLAQVILLPNLTAAVDLVEATELDPHPRGLNGFGSSGG